MKKIEDIVTARATLAGGHYSAANYIALGGLDEVLQALLGDIKSEPVKLVSARVEHKHEGVAPYTEWSVEVATMKSKKEVDAREWLLKQKAFSTKE